MTWTIRSVGARPLTVNKVATLNRFKWAAHTKAVRDEWFWLGKEAGIVRCDQVRIAATPLHKDRRSPQDVAACAPHVKAAVDGLVDAGLIPDDSPAHLLELTFHPPLIDGVDGLELEVIRL